MNTHDIDGARPKPEQILSKPNLNDPSDINKDGHFRTTRRTDPLNPEYQIRDENGDIVTIGNIPGTRPNTTRRFHSTTHNRHLSSHDIEGATVGSARPKFVQTGRKNVRNPNNSDDIPGAKAGTLKKGVKTSRITDPLNPKYDIPGNSEEKPEQTTPKKSKPENNSIQRSPTDPKYLKNEAAFWAVPPPQIKPDTAPLNSQRSVDSEFQRNVGKFFNRSGLATPQTDAREFKHNAELFFETSKDGKAIIEQNLFSKSSIHRSKPRRIDLDPDSNQFLQNSKKFFAASDSERSATERNGLSSAQSISTEYRNNIQKFYDPNPNSAEALRMNSVKFFDGGQPVQPYVFKLSRSEIKQPGKPPINPLESSFKNNLAKFHGITPRQNSGRGLSLAVSASKFFD